jgi:hypothetical protein
VLLHKRHTDAAAIRICESHQNLTSFPTLGTLPACTRHTFRGFTSLLRHTAGIKKVSTAFANSRSPSAPRFRLVPFIHEALTFHIPIPHQRSRFFHNTFPTPLCSILSACPTLRTGCLSTRTLGIALTQQTYNAIRTQESAREAQAWPR